MSQSESDAALEVLNVLATVLPSTVVKHAAALGFFSWQEFGLGLGAAMGKGIVIARTSDIVAPGPVTWSAPVNMTLTGGRAGLTIGYEKARAVFAITTKEALLSFGKGVVLGMDIKVLVPVAYDGIVEEWKTNGDAVIPFTIKGGFKLDLTIAGTRFAIDHKAMAKAYNEGLSVEDIYEGPPSAALQPLYDRLNAIVGEKHQDAPGPRNLLQDKGVHIVDNKWRMGS